MNPISVSPSPSGQETEHAFETLDAPQSADTKHEGNNDSATAKAPHFIAFVDHNRKRFIFPWPECRTWQGVKKLIERAYARNNTSDITSQILEEKFDIVAKQGEVILPEVWEDIIRPGWVVKLQLWSSPEPLNSGYGIPELGSTPPPLPPVLWDEPAPRRELAPWATARAESPTDRRFQTLLGSDPPPSPRPRSDQNERDLVATEEHGNEEHKNSRRGTTKIPKSLAKERVFKELSYQYREEGAFYVIPRPLSQHQIAEIIQKSESRPSSVQSNPEPGSDQDNDEIVVDKEHGPTRAGRRARKGFTKIRKGLAKRQVLVDLGLPFEKEGRFFIILRALDKDQIDEIVKMSKDWRESRSLPRSRSRSRSRPRSRSSSRSRGDSIPYSMDSPESGESSTDSDDSRFDSGSDASDASDALDVTDPLQYMEPRRARTFPRDRDGNLLFFTADSPTSSDSTNSEENPSKESKLPARRPMSKENVDILESHMISDMTSSATKTYLLLRCLNSPKRPGCQDFTSIRWHHLDAFDELDFYQFKKACFGISKLSAQASHAASALLERIEKEKVKTALDGMFIEPGTVMRCDFKDDKGNGQAAIFACVPFFDVQAPTQPRSSLNQRLQQRLHPARTLMSSLYPYEDVLERDQEQAIRKHGTNSSDKNIIHVPLFWMLSIGGEAIVTCGYKKLLTTIGTSMRIERDNLKLGRDESAVDIRLSDWEGRAFLFARERCKTFFEFEQKVREIRSTQGQAPIKGALKFVLVQDKNKAILTPRNWVKKVHCSKSMFVDISVVNERGLLSDGSEAPKEPDTESRPSPNGLATSRFPTKNTAAVQPSTVWKHPFFTWEQSPSLTREFRAGSEKEATIEVDSPLAKKGIKKSAQEQYTVLEAIRTKLLDDLKPSQPEQERQLMKTVTPLALIELNLLSETLDPDTFDHDVEKTFATTDFYEGLQERKFEITLAMALSLSGRVPSEPPTPLAETDFWAANRNPDLIKEIHSKIISLQHYSIAKLGGELVGEISQILMLYVPDLDLSPMLRKVWSALYTVIETLGKLLDESPVTDNKNAKQWTFRKKIKASDTFGVNSSSTPNFGSWLPYHIKRCRKCDRESFFSLDSALEHLNYQFLKPKTNTPRRARDAEDPGMARFWPLDEVSGKRRPDFRHYLESDLQMRMEERNSAFIAILRSSLESVSKLRSQTSELAEGVTFAEEALSNQYTLPMSLVESLRRFAALFLGIERLIYYADLRFQKWRFEERQAIMRYCEDGMTALHGFESSIHISLSEARKDLCFMVRSPPDDSNFLLKLSLGPEFILAWLMRRFVVKPVDHNVGAPELYREYLSALSFQVNHHPRKRLLRDINLLQEELIALDKVNQWQMKVVADFMAVLDSNTFATEISGRRALFEYEGNLLLGCLDHLQDSHEDYMELLGRCQPLSDTTKQSTEINEEDHGKAIFVFTLVTIIFLPLSFVTSYLGMNTVDIRNMEEKQSIFWEIAVPLTAVTIGSILFVAYNGDLIRNTVSSIKNTLMGKKSTKSKHSLSVAQRKRFTAADSSSTLDWRSVADSSEYALPTSNPLAAPNLRMGSRVHFSNDYYGGPVEVEVERMQKLENLSLPNARSGLREPSRTRNYSNNYENEKNSYLAALPVRSRSRTANDEYSGSRPTYARVHRKYVTPDSLAYYGLPWEYDTRDPEYMIITQDLQTYDLDVLFEHSRRVMDTHRRHKSKPPMARFESEVIEHEGRKREYAWVRKRTRSRAPKNVSYVD